MFWSRKIFDEPDLVLAIVESVTPSSVSFGPFLVIYRTPAILLLSVTVNPVGTPSLSSPANLSALVLAEIVPACFAAFFASFTEAVADGVGSTEASFEVTTSGGGTIAVWSGSGAPTSYATTKTSNTRIY